MDYYSYEAMMALLGIYLGFLLVVLVIAYAVTVYPLYQMYKRAGLKNPKVAFIPFFGTLKLFNLANLSMLLYLIIFIPAIGTFALACINLYVCYKIGENFGFGMVGRILTVLFAVPMFWYIALTKKPFVAKINPKYLDNQYNNYSI